MIDITYIRDEHAINVYMPEKLLFVSGSPDLGPYGSQIVQICPKWDNSRTFFQIRFHYILAHRAKMY